MAFILDTSEITAEINGIVDESERFIFIVTASLNINSRLRRLLKLADGKGVRIFVIYGKWEVKNDTMSWLKSLDNCSIGFIKDLHAKVIVNENEAVLSSMNLYTFSQENNEELGSLFVNGLDVDCYDRIIDMLDKYSKMCERQHGDWDYRTIFGTDDPKPSLLSSFKKGFKSSFKTSRPNESVTASLESVPEPIVELPSKFHCIRCSASISDSIYCTKCMKSWKRWSNRDYQEKDGVCLICGNPYGSSFNNPVCNDCRSKYDDIGTLLDRLQGI